MRPPRVLQPHYAIDAWTGADPLETLPVCLVTDRLADALSRPGFSSLRFRHAESTLRPEGEELLRSLGLDRLPTFSWLHISGVTGRDDIGMTPK